MLCMLPDRHGALLHAQQKSPQACRHRQQSVYLVRFGGCCSCEYFCKDIWGPCDLEASWCSVCCRAVAILEGDEGDLLAKLLAPLKLMTQLQVIVDSSSVCTGFAPARADSFVCLILLHLHNTMQLGKKRKCKQPPVSHDPMV